MTHQTRWLRAAMALLLIGCQACHSWEVQPVAPHTFEPQNPGDRYRLGLQNGERYIVEAPKLEGDTLQATRVHPRGPVRIGLAEVTDVAVRRSDAGKTVAAVVMLGVVAAAAAWVIAAASASVCPLGC